MGQAVITHRSCMARVDLDDDEQRWLNTMPDGTDQIGSSLHCGLDAGHTGPHAALGQAAGDDEYWVRWTLRASEIVKLPPCPERAEPGIGGSTGACLLFEHHPGRCTFEGDG
jgi:hypothetical protein